MRPTFSIIIPTYNHLKDCLIPCCESILKYTDLSNTEIIIVANGCDEDTREYATSLQNTFSSIKLLWFDNPLGYAKPTNEGIKYAQGEYIVVLNNDTVLLPQNKNDWLEVMKKPFLEDDKMGITGPMKTFSPSAHRDFIIFFCAMISKKLVDKIGILDESFYSYGEDTDICCRAENAGFKIKQVPVDCNSYYAENRMAGNFPIYHEGNVSHKNFPGGEKLISDNNEKLRTKYNNSDSMIQLVKTSHVNIEKSKQCDGFMSDNELTWLAKQAQIATIFIEIGSWHGKSSRAISDNLPDYGILYCVDTWNGSIVEQNSFHSSAKQREGDHAYYEFLQNNFDLIEEGKIIPLRMSSKNASEFFREKNIQADIIFIDGGHMYEEVIEDINQWKDRVKKCGILCGHDYVQQDWIQVKQAVDKLLPNAIIAPNTSIWYQKMCEEFNGKVFDCFPINNELNILQQRLEELFTVVDRFIIIEADRTHGNKPKPYYFNESLPKFEKYLHKITYIMISDYTGFDSWSIERHQRECIMRGLNQCKENDVIIVSDIDEIPSVEAIKNYKVSEGIKSFEMDLYYYNMTCKAKDKWTEAKILPYGLLKKLTPCGSRYTKAEVIKNGGKHLSYFGGIDSIRKKIEDTAHQEYNTEEFKNLFHIQKAIEDRKDLFNRNLEFEKV